jgi:hypothetical protein
MNHIGRSGVHLAEQDLCREEARGHYSVPEEMAMGKQPKNRDYSDKTRIDLNQPYQVAYWKQRFGVSERELEDAVGAVGTSVTKIEAYLKSTEP